MKETRKMKKKNTLTLFVETPHQGIKEMVLTAKIGMMTRTFEDNSYDVSCHTRRNKKNTLLDLDGRLWAIIYFECEVDADGKRTYSICGERYANGKYSYYNWDISDLLTIISHRYDGDDYLGRTCDEFGVKTGETAPICIGGK